MIRPKKYRKTPEKRDLYDKPVINLIFLILFLLLCFHLLIDARSNLKPKQQQLLAPPPIPNLAQLNGDNVIIPYGYAYYEGGVLNGKLHGSGILKTLGYSYEGDFFENQLHGEGDIVFEQEMLKINELFVLRYEGEFKHNMLDGAGVVQFVNGDVYSGVFKENKFTNGIFLYQDRTFLH